MFVIVSMDTRDIITKKLLDLNFPEDIINELMIQNKSIRFCIVDDITNDLLYEVIIYDGKSFLTDKEAFIQQLFAFNNLNIATFKVYKQISDISINAKIIFKNSSIITGTYINCYGFKCFSNIDYQSVNIQAIILMYEYYSPYLNYNINHQARILTCKNINKYPNYVFKDNEEKANFLKKTLKRVQYCFPNLIGSTFRALGLKFVIEEVFHFDKKNYILMDVTNELFTDLNTDDVSFISVQEFLNLMQIQNNPELNAIINRCARINTKNYLVSTNLSMKHLLFNEIQIYYKNANKLN